MKIFRALALAFSVALAPLAGAFAEAPVVGPSTYSYTANGQYNVWACTGGQSTFQLNVPSGLTGTFTVTVGQGSATATQNPPWSFAPGSAAFANTITNNGSLTVELGSNQYVKVATTAYTSGSTTVSGVCSSSVSVLPPGALTTSANSWSGLQTFNGGVAANSFAPIAFPTPNSSSTIVAFGDSLTYGAYGPTSCVTAQNQPTGVAGSSATGKCWLDVIAHDYNVSAAYDLGVGGSTLTNVGPAGSGQGILRYNASYTCPAQSTSPTSGLDSNCKGSAVIPAFDSLANANMFPIIGYFGHNDNYYNVNAFYNTYLSNLQTIVNDLLAHGVPANHFIFLGSFGGGNGSNVNNGFATDMITASANAYEASLIGGKYVNVITAMNDGILNNNSQSVFYDSIHPNDSTNCVGASCLGGSAVIASAIEATPDLPAAFYAKAMGMVSQMWANQRAPQFDSNGNLAILTSFVVGNTTFGNANMYYSGNVLIGTDGTNTLLRAYPAGKVYIQGSGPVNYGHWDSTGLTMDIGSSEHITLGSTVLTPTSFTLNGPAQINGAYTSPMFSHGGTSIAATQHCVGAGDPVTAGAASTTVSLSGAAQFANANYPLFIEDITSLAVVNPSAQTATSFTFPSTSGHVYAYNACGQ